MDVELTKPPDEDHPEGAIEVLSVDGERVVVRYRHLPERDLTVVRGIPCTTALRTVIDMAPELLPPELERMITECLRRQLFSVDEALRRTAEPDMTDDVGAQLVRSALLRRN